MKKFPQFNPLHFYVRYTLRERTPTGNYFGKPYCLQKERTTLRHRITGEVLHFETFDEAVDAVHSLIEEYRDKPDRVVSPTIQSHTKTIKEYGVWEKTKTQKP